MLSFPENIPIILNAVDEIKPKSIIDIGAGFGKYGLLIREQYLSKKAEGGELSPTDDLIIDAVEDTDYFNNYNNGLKLMLIYNEVYEYSIADMALFMERNYNLALLIDVIEHWDIEYTKKILTGLSEYCDNILISTPITVTMYKQHYYGDKRHHITQYNEQDLIDLNPFRYLSNIWSKGSHIVVYSKCPLSG